LSYAEGILFNYASAINMLFTEVARDTYQDS